MSTEYLGQVSEAFSATPAESFGDAHATAAELGALSALHAWNGRDRSVTRDWIRNYGYPTPDTITPEMVAVTGSAHACGVTEYLAEKRGNEGMKSTYESYTTKNQFDRFVRLHLPEHLRESWEASIDRESGFVNEDISYPSGVDETKIHGGALPHRFLPSQTMRYLEYARLGKLDEETRKEWGITDKTVLEKFAVEWERLIPAIESATTLLELSGNIANELVEQLRNNGLSDEQIAAVINKGYNVDGMIAEHGEVETIRDYAIEYVVVPDIDPAISRQLEQLANVIQNPNLTIPSLGTPHRSLILRRGGDPNIISPDWY